MPSDSANNAFNSDTASMTSPMRVGYDERDESVFLRQQAEDAKIAVQQTLAEMKQTVTAAADIRVLTRQYPWLALGATAVAGFMATRLMLASARSQHESTPAPAPQRSSAMSSFVKSSLINIVRSAVMSTVASLIHANAQADSDEEQTMPHARSYNSPNDEGRSVPIS